jgi:hypothetical protein
MCYLYRRLSAPLNALLKQDYQFVWSDQCESAFHQLKRLLTTAPVLKYPDLNRPFRLYSNASRTGFDTILGQIGADNKEYVIADTGRALNYKR